MLAFVLLLQIYSFAMFFNLSKVGAVGIIGGTDGPTAIYVARQFTSGGVFAVIAVALLLIIVGFVYIKARRKTK